MDARSLSICIAARGACDPLPFLQALRRQGFEINARNDIHLAHDEDISGVAELLTAGWQLHRCPPGTAILRLWGRAIVESTGATVAVLNIQCPPAAGWWEGVQRQLRAGTRLFSGPVASGWRADQVEIVGYLVDYAQFHPPLASDVHETPGINFFCDRSLLQAPATLIENGFYKTFTLWRLQREHQLVPMRRNDVQVDYRRPLRMPDFLLQRYRHGRCFAGCRLEQPKQPPRLLCIAFTPALPWLRCWRILRVARRHRELRAAFWRQLPRVILAECAWSCGEFVGYLLGSGQACSELD